MDDMYESHDTYMTLVGSIMMMFADYSSPFTTL